MHLKVEYNFLTNIKKRFLSPNITVSLPENEQKGDRIVQQLLHLFLIFLVVACDQRQLVDRVRKGSVARHCNFVNPFYVRLNVAKKAGKLIIYVLTSLPDGYIGLLCLSLHDILILVLKNAGAELRTHKMF